MAWTTPMTATTNAVLTAAQWNASVRDNFNETAVAKANTAGTYFVTNATNQITERTPAVNSITTSETTASTSYVDLASVGPTVTVSASASAIVMFSCYLQNNTVNAASAASHDVSGATTAGAADSIAVRSTSSTANASLTASHVVMRALTAGSNTFTAKYSVSAGTGTFANRRLTVLPF